MYDLENELPPLMPAHDAEDSYISTPDLMDLVRRKLPDEPSQKTVVRALFVLERKRMISCDRRGRTLYWRKLPGTDGLPKKPGNLTFDQALALQLLRRFSSRQVPTLVSHELEALFEGAERRLQRPSSAREQWYPRWFNKVAVESAGFTLVYPQIEPSLFSQVSQALFKEQKLEVVYRPKTHSFSEKSKVLLPLGLVEVGGLVYLIATTDGRVSPMMYRMDRLVCASMLPEEFPYPSNFSLEDYVRKQRRFDFMVEGEVVLKLRFYGGAGEHLLETPLSLDQQATRENDALVVTGTAVLSQRLRWWLRSFGPNVEVVEPASLRAEFIEESRQLARIYKR